MFYVLKVVLENVIGSVLDHVLEYVLARVLLYGLRMFQASACPPLCFLCVLSSMFHAFFYLDSVLRDTV